MHLEYLFVILLHLHVFNCEELLTCDGSTSDHVLIMNSDSEKMARFGLDTVTILDKLGRYLYSIDWTMEDVYTQLMKHMDQGCSPKCATDDSQLMSCPLASQIPEFGYLTCSDLHDPKCMRFRQAEYIHRRCLKEGVSDELECHIIPEHVYVIDEKRVLACAYVFKRLICQEFVKTFIKNNEANDGPSTKWKVDEKSFYPIGVDLPDSGAESDSHPDWRSPVTLLQFNPPSRSAFGVLSRINSFNATDDAKSMETDLIPFKVKLPNPQADAHEKKPEMTSEWFEKQLPAGKTTKEITEISNKWLSEEHEDQFPDEFTNSLNQHKQFLLHQFPIHEDIFKFFHQFSNGQRFYHVHRVAESVDPLQFAIQSMCYNDRGVVADFGNVDQLDSAWKDVLEKYINIRGKKNDLPNIETMKDKILFDFYSTKLICGSSKVRFNVYAVTYSTGHFFYTIEGNKYRNQMHVCQYSLLELQSMISQYPTLGQKSCPEGDCSKCVPKQLNLTNDFTPDEIKTIIKRPEMTLIGTKMISYEYNGSIPLNVYVEKNQGMIISSTEYDVVYAVLRNSNKHFDLVKYVVFNDGDVDIVWNVSIPCPKHIESSWETVSAMRRDGNTLLIGGRLFLSRINLNYCSKMYSTCKACVAARDPDCAFSILENNCINVKGNVNSSIIHQDLSFGNTSICINVISEIKPEPKLPGNKSNDEHWNDMFIGISVILGLFVGCIFTLTAVMLYMRYRKSSMKASITSLHQREGIILTRRSSSALLVNGVSSRGKSISKTRPVSLPQLDLMNLKYCASCGKIDTQPHSHDSTSENAPTSQEFAHYDPLEQPHHHERDTSHTHHEHRNSFAYC